MERNVPDEILMLRYGQGDLGAFEQLLERHRRPLFGYLRRMLGSRELAEDTLQEVFIRVINARRRYKKSAKFATWLYKIAHNVSVDALRRESYRKADSLSGAPENEDGIKLEDVITDANPGPDELMARRHFSEVLQNCISRLSPEQREVFVLRQYQDLPFREIARAVGATESTVKSRMRYALNNLRAMLIEERVVEEVAPSP